MPASAEKWTHTESYTSMLEAFAALINVLDEPSV